MNRQPSALGDMLDEATSYAHHVLEQALDACAPADLLAPDRDEITIVREPGGAAQVDLLMPSGQFVTVRFAIDPSLGHDEDAEARDVAAARDGLTAMLAGIDEALARCGRVDAAARRLVKSRRRRGVDMQVHAVRIAPVWLASRTPSRLAIEIAYSASPCHMLRSFHDVWRLVDEDELADRIGRLETDLASRQARLAALPAGAVGFIDSVALGLIGGWPEDATGVLRRVVRHHEYRTCDDRICRETGAQSRQLVGLRWHDGVVRAYAPIGEQAFRDWGELRLPADAAASLAVGDRIDALVPHPAVAGLRVTAISPAVGGDVSVVLEERLMGFTANGELLG